MRCAKGRGARAHHGDAEEGEGGAEDVAKERLGSLRRRRVPVVDVTEDEVGAEVDCVAANEQVNILLDQQGEREGL